MFQGGLFKQLFWRTLDRGGRTVLVLRGCTSKPDGVERVGGQDVMSD